jgi:hypothetical protein
MVRFAVALPELEYGFAPHVTSAVSRNKEDSVESFIALRLGSPHPAPSRDPKK